MMKIRICITAAIAVAFSGMGLSFAQDEADVLDLRPIEIDVCSYSDGQDQDDYDNVMARMVKWMEDNDSEPYAAWRLNKLYAGDQDFDFVYLGAWSSGTSMGKDVAQYASSAGDIIEAINNVVECAGLSMFTSLNVKESDGDGTGSFVLTVSDCNVADGHRTGDAIRALVEYGEYRDATGSPGGMWIWFPTLGNGEEDFDFKLASSYRSVEALGDAFQWNMDNQAYIERRELFTGLLSCNVPRGYIGDTIVNTLPTD